MRCSTSVANGAKPIGDFFRTRSRFWNWLASCDFCGDDSTPQIRFNSDFGFCARFSWGAGTPSGSCGKFSAIFNEHARCIALGSHRSQASMCKGVRFRRPSGNQAAPHHVRAGSDVQHFDNLPRVHHKDRTGNPTIVRLPFGESDLLRQIFPLQQNCPAS